MLDASHLILVSRKLRLTLPRSRNEVVWGKFRDSAELIGPSSLGQSRSQDCMGRSKEAGGGERREAARREAREEHASKAEVRASLNLECSCCVRAASQ